MRCKYSVITLTSKVSGPLQCAMNTHNMLEYVMAVRLAGPFMLHSLVIVMCVCHGE